MKRLKLGRALRSNDGAAVRDCIGALPDSQVTRAAYNNCELLNGHTLKVVLQHLSEYRAYRLRLDLLRDKQDALLYRAYEQGYTPEVLYPDTLAKMARRRRTSRETGQFADLVMDWIDEADSVGGWSNHPEDLAAIAEAFPGRAREVMRALARKAARDRPLSEVRPALIQALTHAPVRPFTRAIDDLGWPECPAFPFEALTSEAKLANRVRCGGLLFEAVPYDQSDFVRQLLDNERLSYVYGGYAFGVIDRSVLNEQDPDQIEQAVRSFQEGSSLTVQADQYTRVYSLFYDLQSGPDRTPPEDFQHQDPPQLTRADYRSEPAQAEHLIDAAYRAHQAPANFAVLIENNDFSESTRTKAAVALCEAMLKNDRKQNGQQTVEPLLQLLDAGLSMTVREQLLLMIPLCSVPDDERIERIKPHLSEPNCADPKTADRIGRTLFGAGVDLQDQQIDFLFEHTASAFEHVDLTDFARQLIHQGYRPDPRHVRMSNALYEAIESELNEREMNFLNAAV